MYKDDLQITDEQKEELLKEQAKEMAQASKEAIERNAVFYGFKGLKMPSEYEIKIFDFVVLYIAYKYALKILIDKIEIKQIDGAYYLMNGEHKIKYLKENEYDLLKVVFEDAFKN